MVAIVDTRTPGRRAIERTTLRRCGSWVVFAKIQFRIIQFGKIQFERIHDEEDEEGGEDEEGDKSYLLIKVKI